MNQSTPVPHPNICISPSKYLFLDMCSKIFFSRGGEAEIRPNWVRGCAECRKYHSNKEGVGHVRVVRPNRAADFRGPPILASYI